MMSRQKTQNKQFSFEKINTPSVITKITRPPCYKHVNNIHSINITTIDPITKIKEIYNYDLYNNHKLLLIKKSILKSYDRNKYQKIMDKDNHHKFQWNGNSRGNLFSGHVINYDATQQRLFFQWKQQRIKYTKYDANIKPWPIYNVQLPHKFDCPRLIFAWDQIIVWFDFFQYDHIDDDETTKYSNIWFLDLKKHINNDNNEYNKTWYKSDIKLPIYDIYYNIPFIVKDNEDNVHLLSFKKNGNAHYKASLLDLLPKEIRKVNEKRRTSLIDGYIRQLRQTELENFKSIPAVLQTLISLFYPLFEEKENKNKNEK